ncbi:DNA-binding LacI/PurR family transcriptional regulator [Sphingomonas jinjuensis]|uniref:DNA-binding LacI/PurR family transcriptional regulator n=1 Tax=Sphingomonas jinjuensis TaxID=535907 RepID=A0A840F8W5_9SPHN|nr:LacI family DNA-binding transcriptional regulator [Sphingomonas jinjuensis]MBB4155663.1 DNA-binding LacI/PurR family transcriptional regulator [Sphingomonas jinjuensis]
MARRATTDGKAGTRGGGRTVTSYDVAQRAGVSQSAVSRCFTTGTSVSPQTRERIMKAAAALGYQPNAIARSLTTKRSNLVAVVVANLGFNPELTATLSRLFASRDLNLLLFTLDHEEDADRVVNQLWQYRVDGVLSATHLPRGHIEQLAKRRVPVVFLNRVYDDIAVNSVCCDQVEGERWLVDRLWAAGHRRFAIVSGPDSSLVSRQRVSGARDRIAALGGDEPAVAIGDFTYDGGRAAMRALAAEARRPDAVICANDMMAIGCIDEIRLEMKLKVPKDMSVVGFDGAAPGRWGSYALTSVRQPVDVMIEAAIDMLTARVDNPAMATEKRVFSGELQIGVSARLG